MASVPPLQRYRDERKWKQTDVAERLGVGRTYVSAIELGDRKLTHTDTRERVARLGYLLPLQVFDALRKGRIGVAKALEASLDREVHATECGAPAVA